MQGNRLSKRNIIYLSGVLVFLVLVALTVFIIQKVRTPKKIEVVEKELVITDELLLPDAPYVQSDYITSRKTKDKWSDSEVEKWFASPNAERLNELHHANNQTIQDILGAAP